MKSQEIKIRNLPVSEIKPKSVRVKPVEILLALVALGVYFIFQRNLLTSTGMVLVLLGISCIILMPDRTLAQFLPDYMIMYNSRDREICQMVYWDEVVSWQYEWHAMSDLLVVTLLDGSTQSVDMYSKRSVAKYMRQFAPNKEKKSSRNKEV